MLQAHLQPLLRGSLGRGARHSLAAGLLLLSACGGQDLESPRSGHLEQARVAWLQPPAPLDRLAEQAAEALLAGPAEDVPLGAWNGLERLAVRLERPAWVAAARARFASRLADPVPLIPAEAEALRERFTEIQPDPRLRERLRAEGWPADPLRPDPWQLLEALRSLVAAPPGPSLLQVWGRAHAWFGHLWLSADAAIGYDGLRPERAGGGTWRVQDLLGVERDFTVRRPGDHASMRWIAAGGVTEVPAHFGRSEPEGGAAGHAH